MKKASLHPQEKKRLGALLALDLLDTLSEKDFDEITFIASQICNTPIALISLVDDHRQWFKSKVGLSASETSKDIAFCSHAILQDDIFEINDTSKDERFVDNPLVSGDTNIQFYAGVPILDPYYQLPIGTLCVIDNMPRTLNENQKKILRALSNQVNKLLHLKVQVKSLEAANEKFQFQNTAFNNMSEGVVLQDSTGKIIDYNRAAIAILGLSADQLVGKSSLDLDWRCFRENGQPFPGDEHPAMITLATGIPQKNIIMGIEDKTCENRWILINSTPIFLTNEKMPSHSVTTFANVTNEKMAQQVLVQTAKMTSLGEMAGGIAHEINTPLAIIISSSSQACKYLTAENPEIEKSILKLKKIESTAKRVAQIVKGLSTFSRNSINDKMQLASVEEIISDTISLCFEKFKYNNIILENKTSIDYKVLCIPTQLSQVILNILNNAHDAILENDNKWVSIELEQKNQKIKLRIIDSGKGIDATIISKLMEPFFSTKEVGKGTGLGLSISKGIIESFAGELYYELYKNNTSFVIELPVPARNE